MLEELFRKAVQLGQRIATEDNMRFRELLDRARSSGPSAIPSQTLVTARLWA
jgi:hypothetical protein